MRAQSSNSSSSKKTLSHPLSRQISLYSLVAAAAGVGIVALAAPAEGEVVVTKKTIPIPLSSLGEEGVGVSFANNGVEDVRLVLSSFSIFGANGNDLKAVNGQDGQGVVGVFRYGAALKQGAKIGPSDHFVSGAGKGTYFSYGKSAACLVVSHTSTFGSREVFGPWNGSPKTAYLGVRFLLDGETHYGWIRLTVNTAIRRGMTATITEYAYETEPNEPIVAGSLEETAAEVHGPSLGMLAVGADGLPLWRREGSSSDPVGSDTDENARHQPQFVVAK